MAERLIATDAIGDLKMVRGFESHRCYESVAEIRKGRGALIRRNQDSDNRRTNHIKIRQKVPQGRPA